MKKNINSLIGLTVLSIVVLHILADSTLVGVFWSRVLDTVASLVAVLAIAYVALGKHANVSVLSGSQRELAAESQQVSSVNLLGGVSDKRPAHVAGKGPTVRVSGFILLGGVTIKELPQPAADPVS